MAIMFGHAKFFFKAATEKDYYGTDMNIGDTPAYVVKKYEFAADPNPTTEAHLATAEEMLALKAEFEARNQGRGDMDYAVHHPLNLWIEFNPNAMTQEEYEAARNGADQDIAYYGYKWRCWWGRPYAHMEKSEPWLAAPAGES